MFSTSPARAEDWPDVESLLKRLDLPCSDLTPASLSDFLVVRQSAAVVGVIGMQYLGPSALLRSLAVDEGYRRTGIASELVHSVELAASSRGVPTIYLFTSTAEPFFAKRGYERIARDILPSEVKATEEFKHLCPATAVSMRKVVSAA